MRKILITLLALVLCLGTFAGCGGEKDIMVITRESGSGTRGAFEEILGMKESDITTDATTFNKTAEVATSVENSRNSIGYISLGSLNDKVKALKIAGVAAMVENVKNNSYLLQRPFILVIKDGVTEKAQVADFLKFIMAAEGQAVLTASGYISESAGRAYDTAANTITGKIIINGSTSVDDVMGKLMGEYQKKQSGNTFEKSATGSSAGIKAAQEGTADIGMSSREIKSTETGLLKLQICLDGIAVIVNKENALGDISKDNLVKVYKGEIKKFSEIR